MTDPKRDLAAEVKATLVDPWRVCELLGIADGAKRQASGLVIRCPSHEERNPSCSVQEKGGALVANCHACGFGGSVLDLIAAVNRLDAHADFPRVVEIGCGLAGIDATVARRAPIRSVPAQEKREPAPDLGAAWASLPPLDADGDEYLAGRGLADAADLCRSVPLGIDGELGRLAAEGYQLAQAMRDQAGRVIAIQVRRLDDTHDADDRDRRFKLHGQSGAGVFGDPLKVRTAGTVVVCEGFTDTLAAHIALGENAKVAVVGVAGVTSTSGLLELPLQGKRVLVAYDADTRGDDAAAKLIVELKKRGATTYRARPTRGKDLADMHRGGVDLAAWLRAVVSQFQSASIAVEDERAGRLAMRGRALKFGVRFLDLALGGLTPDDLALIGALTGKGKTQLALGIARANAAEGQPVHLIALEAGRLEHERRLKYPIIAQLAYDERARNGDLWRRLNFLDWLQGKFDADLDRYERAAEAQIKTELRSLFIRYKGAERFDGKTLERTIAEIGDETSLVIVDHLHFVDSDNPSENRGVRDIVHGLRSMQARICKPIVLVGHLRKPDRARKKPQLVPSIDEFHGASEPGKAATKAVLIAPAYDQQHLVTGPLAATWINPAKCRDDGARTQFVGLVNFNFRTGRYEREFNLARLDPSHEKATFVSDDKLPSWAVEHAPQYGTVPWPGAGE